MAMRSWLAERSAAPLVGVFHEPKRTDDMKAKDESFRA